MTGSHRLPPQPGEVVDRGRPVGFGFDGAPYAGLAGDTIASALAAHGVRVFSRSLKLHRPRGLMTAGWLDPGLMVQVGDDPNVRAGHRLVADGMHVRSQDAWPSLRFDVKAANGLVGRFLGPGFYYKTFIRPRRLWPVYESVLQRFVHAGHADIATPHSVRDHGHEHADVVVAGGGPAGMAAAVAAAELGARVLLVEEDHALGGHWRWSPERREELAELRRRVAGQPGLSAYTDAVVLGRYDGSWLGIAVRDRDGGERLVKSRAGCLVVCAGLVERPLVFAGNDRPGVMLATAVRRLVNLYAVRPGSRAVVLTANAHGDAAVGDLERAGVEVVAVLDARRGELVARTRGRRGVESVETTVGRRIEADLLVTATGWTAPTTLLDMAGSRAEYDAAAARFVPGPLPDDVLVAGGLGGDAGPDRLVEHAAAVGAEAATRALSGGRTVRPVAGLPRDPHPALFRSTTHGFVDFSEDVLSSDLHQAVAEGYDSAELAKRYTTATMGPLQGKLEGVNAIAAVAEARGSTVGETGTTTWRPPYAPVTLGALAGRAFEPVRRSPMQDWHEAHGAVPLVAGAWVRPDHYGDPAAEVRAVRERVGIIDVTPIGKLDLRGPDVPRLLELLYVNRWQRLEVGRVRYGAMCGEDGVVLDDGVTGRLGPEHYLMSTTSSGAAAVWEWVELWLQTRHPEWRVHCTPVTTAYASMNVAGPRSRELLGRLTDLDLDPLELGYMHVRVGTVAGVGDVVVWRIGFTGELSYELHVPASYGQHVWDALLRHGADLGVAPFGVEAQRILRLEKGHLIVGQDTDGLTRAFSAELGWAVRLDKDDFAGAPELRWQREAGPTSVLVGLQPVEPHVVPPEASQVIGPGPAHGSDHGDARAGGAGPEILGRVTSSRFSPTLGRSVCLAQLRTDHASPGTSVRVLLPDGSVAMAVVTEGLAHYDPKGERVRG